MPLPIYWHGCVNQKEFSEYTPTIDRILRGEISISSLQGEDALKVRLNIRSRLIFNSVTIEKKQYLVIHQALLKHNYKDYKIDSDDFNARHMSLWSERVANGDIYRVDRESLAAPVAEDVPQLVYSANSIIFNEFQEEIFDMPTPLVINGPAGTGKTRIIFEMLLDYLRENPDIGTQKFLFVAKSAVLINQLRIMALAIPEAELLDHMVEFKTYAELIQSIDNRYIPENEVGITYFKKWLAKHLKLQEKNLRMSRKDLNLIKDRLEREKSASRLDAEQNILSSLKQLDDNSLYEELSIIAGYHYPLDGVQSTDYLKLGHKQSVFHKKASQDVKLYFMEIYRRYQAHLDSWEQGFHYDSTLCIPSMRKKYRAIFLDEFQALPLKQQLFLLDMCDTNLYCSGDSAHQRIGFVQSSTSIFIDLLGKIIKRSPSVALLSDSYRCPKAVIRVKNTLIRLKRLSIGGTTEHGEPIEIVPHPSKEEGECHILNTMLGEDEQIRELTNSADCFVITRPGLKEQARTRYPGAQVYEFSEVIGMECRWAILYEIFNDRDPIEAEIDRVLRTKDYHTADAINHIKNHDNESALNRFNEWLIAIGRATSKVYFVQDIPVAGSLFRSNQISVLLEMLLSMISPDSPLIVDRKEVQATSNLADWERRADENLLAGNLSVAESIYLNHLGRTTEDCLARKLFICSQTAGISRSDTEVIVETAPQKKQKKSSPKKKSAAIAGNSDIKTESAKSSELELKESSSSPKVTVKSSKPSPVSVTEEINREKTSSFSPIAQIDRSSLQDEIPKLLNNFTKKHLDYMFKRYKGRFLSVSFRLAGHGFIPELLGFVLTTPNLYPIFINYLQTSRGGHQVSAIVEDTKYNDGSTALHLAASLNSLQMMNILIEKGADIHAVNDRHEKPLFIALINGNFLAAEILVKAGCKLTDAIDIKGRPHYYAFDFKSEEVYNRMADGFYQRTYQTRCALPDGVTNLYLQAQLNFLDEATKRVKTHPEEVNTPVGPMNATPLFIAVQLGHIDMVKLLISSGADVFAKLTNGVTPLLLASQSGFLTIAEYLIAVDPDGHNLEQETIDGITPIISATYHRRIQLVALLVDCHANIMHEAVDGATIRSIISKRKLFDIGALLDDNKSRRQDSILLISNPSLVRMRRFLEENHRIYNLLRRVKIDVDRGPNRRLIEYILSDNTMSQLLVDCIDIDLANCKKMYLLQEPVVSKIDKIVITSEGFTSLHLAVLNQSTIYVDCYLNCQSMLDASSEYRLNINSVNRLGETPLSISCSIKSTIFARKLILANANIYTADHNGYTPLHLSAENGLLGVVCLLIKKSDDQQSTYLNAINRYGNTALMLAIENGHENVAIVLIRQPSTDVNCLGEDGKTALILAIELGSVTLVKELIERGADVNYILPNGISVLMAAVCSLNKDVVEALFKTNVNINQQIQDGLNQFQVMCNDERKIAKIQSMHDHFSYLYTVRALKLSEGSAFSKVVRSEVRRKIVYRVEESIEISEDRIFSPISM
ncbi:MAG: ankyrin repeat domain-containing protein [Legionellaceae bacterium]|nr:ankyrin repeat domain-containing protein [Legionellaceae bacterium]